MCGREKTSTNGKREHVDQNFPPHNYVEILNYHDARTTEIFYIM